MTIATFAPVKVSVEFMLTDGDQVAKASFDCPPGELPTAEQIAVAAASVQRQVSDQLGKPFSWQTREEFIQDLFEERTGQRGISVPGPREWQADWAQS